MISVKITATCNQQNDSTGSDTLLLKVNNVELARLDITAGEARSFNNIPIGIGDTITIWESDLLDADDQLSEHTVTESDESTTKTQAHIGSGNYVFTYEFN